MNSLNCLLLFVAALIVDISSESEICFNRNIVLVACPLRRLIGNSNRQSDSHLALAVESSIAGVSGRRSISSDLYVTFENGLQFRLAILSLSF